jgi:hypothetical protein
MSNYLSDLVGLKYYKNFSGNMVLVGFGGRWSTTMCDGLAKLDSNLCFFQLKHFSLQF